MGDKAASDIAGPLVVIEHIIRAEDLLQVNLRLQLAKRLAPDVVDVAFLRHEDSVSFASHSVTQVNIFKATNLVALVKRA